MESDTQKRLLEEAADLIAESPGEDFSLRAVCDAAGVKLPTLYHFFGSKQGLIDAVIQYGFDLYVAEKSAVESAGDPIQDIRAGWDAHVAFGLENPGFYALMYGTVRPGYVPSAQMRPNEILLNLTTKAADEGRLTVSPEQAAAHILATNIGVTLRQIATAEPDPDLSRAAREATISGITRSGAGQDDPLAASLEVAASNPEVLGSHETQLLIDWLRKLHQKITK